MSYTIVADVCECISDCIYVCPVECIHLTYQINIKGTRFSYIDNNVCTDCGVCLAVCPIEGAIIDEWKPELQISQVRRDREQELNKKYPDPIKVMRMLDKLVVIGDSKEVVMDTLGKPEEITEQGSLECWHYQSRSKIISNEPFKVKCIYLLEITFDGDIVVELKDKR